MNFNIELLSNQNYDSGRLTFKNDSVIYKSDPPDTSEKKRHFDKALAKVNKYLEENPLLQLDLPTIIALRRLADRIKPVRGMNENWKSINQWVLRAEWSQGIASEERPDDQPQTCFLKPSEPLKENCERVHLFGHTFPYRRSLLEQISSTAPDFNVICQGQTFKFSREVLTRESEFFRSSQPFIEKSQLQLIDFDPKAVAMIFLYKFGGFPLPTMDLDLTWEYFDLAQYLQFKPLEEEMANQYLRRYLERSYDVLKPFDPEIGVRLQKFITRLNFSHFECLDGYRLKMLKDLKLTNLDVSHNLSLRKDGFALIGQMTSLVDLNVGYSPMLGDEGVKHLSLLTNLTQLDLSAARQVDHNETFESLRGLTKLESLKLNDSQAVAAQCLTCLHPLPLRNLELQGSTTDFSQLTGLTRLTRLDYSNHINLDIDELRKVAKPFPELKCLVLKNCQFKDPEAIRQLESEYSSLKVSV